jgi:ABC-type transporter Mla subunit MlaD
MSTASSLPHQSKLLRRLGVTVFALVSAVVWFSMGPASAQESPTTTASMTVNANAVTDEGSPQSTEGLVVFVVVVAVIAIGAAVVFYRGWRRKGSQSAQTR